MTDPTGPDALEGSLSTVTDDEWHTAHLALVNSVDWPVEELQYVWDPDLPGDTLVDPDESDEAPEANRG